MLVWRNAKSKGDLMRVGWWWFDHELAEVISLCITLGFLCFHFLTIIIGENAFQ